MITITLFTLSDSIMRPRSKGHSGSPTSCFTSTYTNECRVWYLFATSLQTYDYRKSNTGPAPPICYRFFSPAPLSVRSGVIFPVEH